MSNNSENINRAFKNVNTMVKKIVDESLTGVTKEVTACAYRVSNELRNSSQYILRGQRSGRRYRLPHSRQTYQASAAGEAPANRTGVFRLSWGTHVHVERHGKTFKAISAVESDIKVKSGHLLGEILEKGTKNGNIAPRPYAKPIIDRALPKIKAIYNKSFTL